MKDPKDVLLKQLIKSLKRDPSAARAVVITDEWVAKKKVTILEANDIFEEAEKRAYPEVRS